MQTIGGDVARIAVDLWNNTWDDQNHFLDKNTRLMISIANAVGSGRYDYAAKELLRAYENGIASEALDDIFSVLYWNHGPSIFTSEIMKTEVFKIYYHIRTQEKDGIKRCDIIANIKEKFKTILS